MTDHPGRLEGARIFLHCEPIDHRSNRPSGRVWPIKRPAAGDRNGFTFTAEFRPFRNVYRIGKRARTRGEQIFLVTWTNLRLEAVPWTMTDPVIVRSSVKLDLHAIHTGSWPGQSDLANFLGHTHRQRHDPGKNEGAGNYASPGTFRMFWPRRRPRFALNGVFQTAQSLAVPATVHGNGSARGKTEVISQWSFRKAHFAIEEAGARSMYRRILTELHRYELSVREGWNNVYGSWLAGMSNGKEALSGLRGLQNREEPAAHSGRAPRRRKTTARNETRKRWKVLRVSQIRWER